jgi:hypothetical protein
MSGHSLKNKRVYAPRPQTAPPGCKDKTSVVPLPPSQGSPLLLPKGNSNPGEQKKNKTFAPLPKKSSMTEDAINSAEDLDLDVNMVSWELNRNSPRDTVIHVEQETRRPTTPTPKTPPLV